MDRGESKLSLSDSVWSRSGTSTMSRSLFNLMLGFWTAAGIASSAVAAWYAMSWTLGWGLLLGTFVVAIAGIFIALSSDNPVISLVGYAMVTIPFGLMLGPVVALYTAASVVKVFAITTGMVVGLGFLGAIWPESLESWGGPLFGALILLILGGLFVPIAGYFGMPVEGALTWLDWIAVFVFGAYVIFDLNRAQRVPRTLDNSIDCALAVYLDFANLFIRLLSLMGKRD